MCTEILFSLFDCFCSYIVKTNMIKTAFHLINIQLQHCFSVARILNGLEISNEKQFCDIFMWKYMYYNNKLRIH